MLLNQFLLLGAVLFCIGVYGVIARKNAVMVLMSIELILNSVNLNLLAFAMRSGTADGHTFALCGRAAACWWRAVARSTTPGTSPERASWTCWMRCRTRTTPCAS